MGKMSWISWIYLTRIYKPAVSQLCSLQKSIVEMRAKERSITLNVSLKIYMSVTFESLDKAYHHYFAITK